MGTQVIIAVMQGEKGPRALESLGSTRLDKTDCNTVRIFHTDNNDDCTFRNIHTDNKINKWTVARDVRTKTAINSHRMSTNKITPDSCDDRSHSFAEEIIVGKTCDD